MPTLDHHEDSTANINEKEEYKNLRLFNIGNLSTRTVIEIFAGIFPKILCEDYIMDLDIEITFFEFFQAFILCCEESIKVKEEENLWREKFTPRQTEKKKA